MIKADHDSFLETLPHTTNFIDSEGYHIRLGKVMLDGVGKKYQVVVDFEPIWDEKLYDFKKVYYYGIYSRETGETVKLTEELAKTLKEQPTGDYDPAEWEETHTYSPEEDK